MNNGIFGIVSPKFVGSWEETKSCNSSAPFQTQGHVTKQIQRLLLSSLLGLNAALSSSRGAPHLLAHQWTLCSDTLHQTTQSPSAFTAPFRIRVAPRLPSNRSQQQTTQDNNLNYKTIHSRTPYIIAILHNILTFPSGLSAFVDLNRHPPPGTISTHFDHLLLYTRTVSG